MLLILGVLLLVLLFLMYRVELKVAYECDSVYLSINVPNVPCGVERFERIQKGMFQNMFLMYRVELKGSRLWRVGVRVWGS